MKVYLLALFLAATVPVCDGVHVTVGESQRLAMLFQSVVLPCKYHTTSTQAPVVQWWYKSYCRDRTRESFTLGINAADPGAESHTECPDSSRSVHVVASAQGSSLTLAERYKGRDITINDADLRIGKLEWGDSGVYFCKVVIANDLEGRNEAHLELLVLEWVFVACVALGSVLFLLLLGICWCQCCPHSCCCYVRCCCCPDTCCCPRHLYEAGKSMRMAKSPPPPQVPVYPYYIPGVPTTMVPLAPSSLVDPKIVSLPSVETNLAGVRSGYRLKSSQSEDSMKVLYYIEKELAQFPSAKMAALQPSSLSELSSLHEGGTTDFRHTYQTVQLKALPPIADLDDQSVLRVAPSTKSRRHRRDRVSHSDDELETRWNPRSEHLQRKTLSRRGRTGSLDELEEFARSYDPRARRPEPRHRASDRDYPNDSPPRRLYDEDDSWRRRSPSPVAQKRRDTWDSDRPCRPPQGHAKRGRGYDDALLNSALESKARGRGGERGAGRIDEDSDTPSKGSSRGKGSDSYYSRSPSNRPEEDDPLPPYSEVERYRRAENNVERYRTVEPHHTNTQRYRTTDPSTRPFSYTRPHQDLAQTLQGGREERDRSRNMNTALSRGSLIV
ncbi:immunoglobulin-like domain-containing receptor 2 isoform X2 [Genypterus blacodes]|uniref:immunoglobulin-like domain-containing receptor 2 isoform X2 n=1 Tax=Genypterus blacodes TaxID=154954 RepID=UPI003F76113A